MDQRQAALEGWLRFNDEDVAVNRDGRLSPRQRRGLLWSAIWRLALGPAVAVVAALVAAADLSTALLVLLALIGLCMGLQLSWSGFAFMVDATSGAVAFVTAALATRVVRGRYTSYYADVGPVRKRINAKAYRGLLPAAGATYHLYYAPGCRGLLSMETASTTEPLPAHPFGPDSAHAWDRLRWSWILITTGVFGALLGAHLLATAHPAEPVRVAGTVANYVEYTTSGRGAHTERTIYLVGDGNAYTPQAEAHYTPVAPDFFNLIGTEVVLFVDQGTTDVLALNDGDTTYASDWYLHPDHEKSFLVTNAALTAGVGGAFVAAGLWLLLRDRRLTEQMPGRSAVYVPPTVHALPAMWSAGIVLAGVLAFIGLAIASAK